MKKNDIINRRNKVNDFIEGIESEVNKSNILNSFYESMDFKIKSVNKKYEDMPIKMLVEMFSDLYVKSLPLDREYKDCVVDELYQEMEMFIHDLGGYDYFKGHINRKNKPILGEALLLIEGKCNKMKTEEVASLKKGNCEDASMDDDERFTLSNITGDMEYEQIQKIIHDNVLDTVNNEIEKAKREKEIKEELEEEISQNVEITTESEAIKFIERKLNIPSAYQPSLFESIQVNIYNEKGNYLEMDNILSETIKEYTKYQILQTLYLEDFLDRDTVKEIGIKYCI